VTNDSNPFLSTAALAPADRLIFALDVPNESEAIALVDRLGDSVTFYKLGLQLFMAEGYWRLVDALKQRGKRVFADLKFFDVPETVKHAVSQLCGRGIDYVTVHGNQSIMEAAAAAKGDTVKVLAVTVLTSLDQGDLDDLGFTCSPEELVFSRARRALATGCDGVISSGMEAARIRSELGQRLLVVTPGIRPVANRAEDDQKRTMTLEAAFLNGADQVVIGRPIRQAADPAAAAFAFQEEIARIFQTRSA
jgi:orotidine-5'-phosphate decarboxylase